MGSVEFIIQSTKLLGFFASLPWNMMVVMEILNIELNRERILPTQYCDVVFIVLHSKPN